MIQLTCTNCQTVLAIDDGFAGGVCRCKHCGTIQTVPPPQTRRPPKPTGAGVKLPPESPRTLLQPPSATGSASSPLHELAQIVASSGLSSSGFAADHARPPHPQPWKSNTTLLVSVGAAILVVLAVVVTYLITRNSTPISNQVPSQPGNAALPPGRSTDLQNSPPTTTPATPLTAKTPTFMGLPLKGPSVVYLLDRGSGTTETFDYMKLAALNSIDSLGPQIKFQLIFWETTGKIVAWPPDAVRYATEQNAAACRDAVADVYCLGQSSIGPALDKALAQNPAEIVVATGKSGLDEDFVTKALAARKSSAAKIHAFCLGNAGSPEPLKSLAEKTGGQFRLISMSDLRDFAD